MRYRKILIILVSLIVFMLLIFIGYDTYKNSLLEFNKFIDRKPSLLIFEKDIEGNKIVYSHKGKLKKYVGTILLIRGRVDDSHISDEFKTNIGSIDQGDLENRIVSFVNDCKEYVNSTDAETFINIKKNIDQELVEEDSLVNMLENDLEINYTFQDLQKLYMINVKKEDNKVIAIFSYNGEIPKVKTPGELTKEEIEKSFEEIVSKQNNNELGVG